MSKIHLSKAESWDTIYSAAKFINFTAFDYATVKQALIDYFKLYHPEFNNWIETDEFVMNLEAFAYISELFSYRLDMNANENLWTTAQRKDTILKLAKFISYKPSRNKPGIGLVKITSVQTSENVYDINGVNLANTTIIWNDINNPNWKHQFFTVMNSVIVQTFGEVPPDQRKQIYDQIFELYTVDNIPVTNCVIPYTIQTQNKTINMELVSAELSENGPVEHRPHTTNKFNILYGTDGLGDLSNYTGFFILTKQGTLNKVSNTFANKIPHDSFTPTFLNVNDIDVWVNKVNGNELLSPLWEEVETTNAQNIIFNSSKNKYRYEVETLDNDQVRFWFGDGDFAAIPDGTFDFWVRSSEPNPIPIPASAVNNIKSNFAFLDSDNLTQNVIFEFSLVSSIQTAGPSEDLEHIKRNAPSVYYTQNRMVNGRDYNTYLLQDNSILKLTTINRSYIGESKYTRSSDPSDTYQNINHFGTDMSLYIDTYVLNVEVSIKIAPLTLITNTIQPLLSDDKLAFYKSLHQYVNRRYFTDSEIHNIIFNYMGDVYWATDGNPPNPVFPFIIYSTDTSYGVGNLDASNDWIIKVEKTKNTYVVYYKASELVANSSTTKFRVTSSGDKIVLLDNNSSNYRSVDKTTVLPYNIVLPILRSRTFTNFSNEYNNLTDYNSVMVSVGDKNQDAIPDYNDLQYLINNTITINADTDNFYEDRSKVNLFNHVFDMPFDYEEYDIALSTIALGYEVLTMDINITGDVDSTSIVYEERNLAFTDKITILEYGANSKITITIPDYVYMYRDDFNSPYHVVDDAARNWYAEYLTQNFAHYTRKNGRSNLNYLWQHSSSENNRINPATTNIMDSFIITRGYYQNMMNWINGSLTNRPAKPNSYDLKTAYNHLLGNKMMSDELILKSGEFKIIFGNKADTNLQASFAVVKSALATYTDNQIKNSIVSAIYDFFDINDWNFGDTFNFTELSTYVHNSLPNQISSFVIIPAEQINKFGSLFQIFSEDNEILMPHVTIDDIEIVSSLSPAVINQ
jgi:hypothetical protein